MKTYVLMVSKVFLKGHDKAGQQTHFEDKIQAVVKKHTIRLNYFYWDNIVKQVNAGNGYLSVRVWKDKPYKSKQQEVIRLQKLGIQRLDFNMKIGELKIDDRLFNYSFGNTIAKNDGLTPFDFQVWFSGDNNPVVNAAIIHFTELRYIQ